MTTNIPQFHEKRLTLIDLDAEFRDAIGGPEVIDIGQTIRVMLGEFFYGEPVEVCNQEIYTQNDRSIVFPMNVGCTLDQVQLDNAIELIGDLFWSLNDTISSRALMLTTEYTHRPSDCFYKFYPSTRELVVYVPVMQGFDYPVGFASLDGRAVITICQDTLPSHLVNQIQ